MVAVLAAGAYLLAYRQGRLHARQPPCECGRISAHMLEEEEVLDLMPHSERAMVTCLLEKPETRALLRRRLHRCLNDLGAMHPATAANLIAPPSPPPPLQQLSDSALQALAAEEAAAALKGGGDVGAAAGAGTSDASAPGRAMTALVVSSPPPPVNESPLQKELRLSREAEDELVSAPLAAALRGGGGKAEAAVPAEVQAAAAGPGRLCLITCVANGRFLTLEPGKDWIQCGGDAATGTALHEGLFAQEVHAGAQLSFRHVRTGRYLQVVPPGEKEGWVVRAHATSVGPSELFEMRGRDNTYLYNVGSGGHITRRFGFVVRAHGDTPGKPAGRIPAARMRLQYYTLEQLKATYAETAARLWNARAPLMQQVARIHALGATNEMRVISYGLYGGAARYTIGVLRNAELAPLVYPGWKVRVYLDKTVPKAVVAQLEALGAQLKWMDGGGMNGGIGGMFWRFLVAADPDVDRFIIRDSDSRLNPRERLAVEEWISSGKRVHSIRDHPNHDRPLNGGMWGGVKSAVPDMANLVKGWSNRESYMGDLDFLNKKVWTRDNVRNSQMSHDAYTCHKYPNARPFPTRRPPDYQHVGQVFFGDGRPRMDDITQFLVGTKAPRQCRGDPSWTSG